MSLSGDGTIAAIGGPGENATGATWVFSTKAPTPPLPPPPPQCVNSCRTHYQVDRLVCHFNIGPVLLPKTVCVIQARVKKMQCVWQALTLPDCFYDNLSILKLGRFMNIMHDLQKAYNGSQCYAIFQIEKRAIAVVDGLNGPYTNYVS